MPDRSYMGKIDGIHDERIRNIVVEALWLSSQRIPLVSDDDGTDLGRRLLLAGRPKMTTPPTAKRVCRVLATHLSNATKS
ncbi:hypothetical protein IG631_19522 [Alternaria alternata]|nr:hypothetical protein IG631_19522 [Alternaria alternata]